MDQYVGRKYKQVKAEKFDDYLKFIGIGLIPRKIAASVSPVVWLTKNDDGSYALTMSTALRTILIKFHLGQEFEETRPDGAKLKSLVTFENNRMIHIQREENGRTSRHVREFSAEEITHTTTVDGWPDTVLRVYKIMN